MQPCSPLAAFGRPGASTGPVIPPFTDFVLSAGLFNLNPVGYEGGEAFRDGSVTNAPFLTTSPYVPDYSGVTNFELNRLYDQSALGNRFNSGTGNPSLILTSPTVVAGAGTAGANGTLTYFGQTNERYSAVYDGSTDPAIDGIIWTGSEWRILLSGNAIYSSTDDVQYAWEVTTWTLNDGDAPVPTVTKGTPDTAIIAFDSVSQQLVSISNVFSGGSEQGTIYCMFYYDGASEFPLFAIDSINTDGSVWLSVNAGVLTGAIREVGGINSKISSSLSTGWHFVAFGFDGNQVAFSDQTVLYVDGIEGVESSTDNLSGIPFGDALGYMGIDADGNKGAYRFLGIAVKNVLDTPAQMEAMRLWVESIPK